MTLKEQITEKKSALLELEPMLKADDVSDETIAQGDALVKEIEELEVKLAKAEKAAKVLESIGTENSNTDESEVKTMTDLEMFAKSAKEMTDKKAGVSVHLKGATDVVSSVQLADVDRSIAPLPTRRAVADYFSGANISGNAITYFVQGAYEGTPAITAEGAKKPQNSTSFTSKTEALSKIAAYIKETDEILYDEPFLASEVQNSLIYQVGKVEDATIVNKILGTSGIGAAEYNGTTVTFADGILKAIMKIKDDSAYDASVVMLNPADVFSLFTSKDANRQYYGGGYFVGAYGANGNFALPSSIWGVEIFANSNIAQGTALVAAREAVKIWRKSGIDVRLFEQNEDDAIYNRVTLVGETRLAAAVVDTKGVVLLSSEES